MDGTEDIEDTEDIDAYDVDGLERCVDDANLNLLNIPKGSKRKRSMVGGDGLDFLDRYDVDLGDGKSGMGRCTPYKKRRVSERLYFLDAW